MKVVKVEMIRGGNNYNSVPTVKLEGGGGTGAEAIASIG